MFRPFLFEQRHLDSHCELKYLQYTKDHAPPNIAIARGLFSFKPLRLREK